MCGIVGILNSASPGRGETAAAMVRAISHRGPNGRMVHTLPRAALGHARLSIIDLDDRASQPMYSANGRHAIVFNGEIYNYRELKRELADRYPFRTQSDTEVLLAAYDIWGPDCLKRLNGMFAFCIYDRVDGSAFLARDRFGQKPLFVAMHGGALLFASEIKALIAAGVQPQPDRVTWARYLKTAACDDSNATFFAGIKQISPGECASYKPGGNLLCSRYYSLGDHLGAAGQISVEAAAEEIRTLMVDAVRIHMHADVPVGISLSGGLDSSAILACLELGGGLPKDLACFSMEYGTDYSERRWIDAAAGKYGTVSTYSSFSREAFLDSITPGLWHQEAPLGGLPNCALGSIAARARDAGVIVVQDGTGLDEAFGGYRNHHGFYVGQLLSNSDPQGETALAEFAANWGLSADAARREALTALTAQRSAIDGTNPIRSDLLHPSILTMTTDIVHPDTGMSQDPLKCQLANYIQANKIPRNMRMKDRATMAYGIELRLPFLDHRLIEAAISLPNEFYFLHGRSKAIVREAMKGAMDEEVRIASKRSIQAPQELWLRSEPMRSYVEDLLSSTSFGDRAMVDPEEARKAYGEFCRFGAANSFFVWQWINMEEWHRTFVDASAVARPQPACMEVSAYFESQPEIVVRDAPPEVLAAAH